MNTNDFSNMTPEDLERLARKMREGAAGEAVSANIADNEERTALPSPSAPQVRPAAEVWGSNEFDFVCPSGARCRMRKLMPEKLLESGILDQLTSLPGYVAEVVDKAEGQPPKKDDEVNPKDITSVLEVLEKLIPMVVVEPGVSPVPVPDETGHVPERREGRIYTDSIELQDRIAIMERAVKGVRRLEPFRTEPGQPA
jgi:hypothetical protein